MEHDDILRLLTPALNEVSNGVTMADARAADRPLVYVNRAFERITGYSSAESLGRNCRFLQGAGTDPRAVEKIRVTLRDGEPCHVCLRNYRKDGTPFLNELKILPIRDESGEIACFIGIQNDVSAQLVARALREREELPAFAEPVWRVEHLGFTLAVDSPFPRQRGAEAGVLVADRRGQILYASRSASRIVGAGPTQLQTTNVFDHFDADWLSEALRPESQTEHEWLTVRLCGAAPRETRAELSTYRVVLEHTSRPWYVILIRDLEKQGKSPSSQRAASKTACP